VEAFAIRPGFVGSAPRLTAEIWNRAARVTMAVALVLLTSYAAPRLVMHAHTTSATPASIGAAAAGAETKAPFDVDSVVDRASHAIAPVAGATGVRDAGYRARFDHTGFSYAPTAATLPLAVSLTHIARGEHSLLGNIGAWTSAGNVARRTVSQGVREQVTSTDGALEWDVVLARAPTGVGALTVTAALSGVVGRPTRVDGNTAWQLSLAGGSHVKLGETVVKDATGAALYRALPVVTAGKIVLVVPEAVLTTAHYPLTIDPTVSAPATLATAGLLNDPAVASDGTNYLVVWAAELEDFGDWKIYGARVSGDGSFVQPLGQISPTATAGHSSVVPDVAWNGSSYLVVWQFDFSDTDVDIHGQRVAASGALLGNELIISQPAGFQQRARVVAAGATFYVVWQDDRAGNDDIYGGRVNSAGTRLDGDGAVVANDPHDEQNPDVAWNGNNFLVVFDFVFSSTDIDVHARPVSSSGVAIGTRQVISGGGAVEQHPTISSQGTEFFVAWEDNRNQATTGTDIYGARLGAAGTVTTGGIAISRAAGAQNEPSIAFNGTYLVVWLDGRNSRDDLYAARLNANGAVQDANGFAVSARADEFTPDVVRGPGTKWAVDDEYFDGSTSHVVHRTIAPK
jgi:hypothetical protein